MGRVLDAGGAPRVNVVVRLIRRETQNGATYLVGGTAVTTNDLGAFSFYGLQASEYLIHLPVGGAASSTPLGVSTTLAAEQFFPAGQSMADAGAVSLGAGQALEGLELTSTQVQGFKVVGSVVGEANRVGIFVRMVADGSEEVPGTGAISAVDDTGGFSFTGVPKGRYSLIAGGMVSYLEDRAALMSASSQPRPLGGARVSMASMAARRVAPGVTLRQWTTSGGVETYGAAMIDVQDRDLSGITVPLQRLASVAGTVEWDNGNPVQPDTIGAIMLESSEGRSALGVPRGVVAATGARTASFSIVGVRPGEYLVRLADQSRVRASARGDRETDPRLEVAGSIGDLRVVLASQMAVIAGTVARSGDRPLAVLLVPADPVEWSDLGWSADRVRVAPVALDGQFRIADLPAGAFTIVAVEEAASTRWRDLSFLRQIRTSGIDVTVNWGESRNVALKLTVSGSIECGDGDNSEEGPLVVHLSGTGRIASHRASAPVRANGEFDFHSLLPGSYLIRLRGSAPYDYRVYDGTVRVVDANVTGVRVRCSRRATLLHGVAHLAPDQSPSSRLVVAVGETGVRLARPDSAGRYEFATMWHGRVFVGVADDIGLRDKPDAVVAAIRRAGQAIDLSPGETYFLSLSGQR